MDGVHDMGGMDGFGKVEPEPNEPVFHAAWEGRVMAMQRAMGYAGAWHIDMSRFAQERLAPVVYLSASYYQRWALAMERNVVERGYAGEDELAAGHALRPGKEVARRLRTPDLVGERGRPLRPGEQPAPVQGQCHGEGLRLPRGAKHRPIGIARNAWNGRGCAPCGGGVDRAHVTPDRDRARTRRSRS